MAEPIKISGKTLETLRQQYGDQSAAIETRLAVYPWAPGNVRATVALAEPLPLRLGGAGFTAGVGLAKAIELVRKNIGERLDTVWTNSDDLNWGLQFLLENSKAVEGFNTMTAAEFESYIPAGSASPVPGGSATPPVPPGKGS
ncbi:hypothetical protein CC117_27360 [Parafrankia colletiae]|uniref:Uncharacterized protein n=1 Tax=Parafrankia colletiae TaxID=573497 RepID=A0A1S1Q7H3_9ACTN|nr:hypothetical protein [Parafrankia colletiae]MCK9904847.1 hypothetical protein [Frankia sp. Cpl3]OHV30838.1 hypothetical protein CC117_27360 [Parafrankia colletiae]